MARRQQTARWFTSAYCEIQSAEYDEDENVLTVAFADGDVVRLDPSVLLPPEVRHVEWWTVASNKLFLVVRHADGWIEVPFDVIRVHTDPEFAEHLRAGHPRSARTTGLKLRALREERRLSLEALAELLNIQPDALAALEAGDPLSRIWPNDVVEALGFPPETLFTVGDDEEPLLQRAAS